jgi:hypothetical protein
MRLPAAGGNRAKRKSRTSASKANEPLCVALSATAAEPQTLQDFDDVGCSHSAVKLLVFDLVEVGCGHAASRGRRWDRAGARHCQDVGVKHRGRSATLPTRAAARRPAVTARATRRPVARDTAPSPFAFLDARCQARDCFASRIISSSLSSWTFHGSLGQPTKFWNLFGWFCMYAHATRWMR